MDTKYYLLTKDGNRVDDVPRTREELGAKLNEIMKREHCDEDAINDRYDYQEVSSSDTESSDGQPETNDEFKSKEDNNGEYEFSAANDISKPTIGDDEKGWNAILDQLKLPEDIAELVRKHKADLELGENNKGVWPIKKNAIRVLYLYNEFLKFYGEITNGEFPSALSSFMRDSGAYFRLTRSERAFDVIKKDMGHIIESMLEILGDYYTSTSPTDSIQEFYDEIKDFDEEIENVHGMIKWVGYMPRFAKMLADSDEKFNKYCNGKPTGKALSAYLMDIAVNKYHLGRIKMDFKNPKSTLDWHWLNPEDTATANVRLSEDINDYLNLKNTGILGEPEKEKLDEIKRKFSNGEMKQKDAQTEINALVISSRRKLRQSLEIFFDFMGINDPNVMNQFTSGLKRLDETEYKNNWLRLVENYKEAMEKNIKRYRKAHANDMTAEDLDNCVAELELLLANADSMLEDVKNESGDKLLSDSQEICRRISDVQKKTAVAKRSFKND